MNLVDSHCHLDSKVFHADLSAVIDRARQAGVGTLVNVSMDVGLAEAHDFIWAVAGVHPHEAAQATDAEFERVRELSFHPKVVAVGEIGLDYHYDFSPRETQRAVFVRQLEIARASGKPVVIHTREAWDDTVAILRDHWRGGGIFHCFSEGPREAETAVEMGFHLSFSGIITFPNAQNVREAARLAPAGRLLVETDAPYLAPDPHRGKRNEPAFVAYTAARLAALRGVETAMIQTLTTDNWRRLCMP